MFKRIFIFTVCIAICMFFYGCENNQNNVEKRKGNMVTQFTADFSATYKNIDVDGKITTGAHGMTVIDFTSPKTINGLEVTYKDNQTEISCNSLKSTADEAFLPDNSMPKIIYSVISAISNCTKSNLHQDLQQNENSNTYVFEISQGNCVITTNSTGFLTSACVDDVNFKIDFYNQMNIQQ